MEPVQGQLALDSVPYGYAYGVMLDTTIPVFHPQDLAVFFDYNIPTMTLIRTRLFFRGTRVVSYDLQLSHFVG